MTPKILCNITSVNGTSHVTIPLINISVTTPTLPSGCASETSRRRTQHRNTLIRKENHSKKLINVNLGTIGFCGAGVVTGDDEDDEGGSLSITARNCIMQHATVIAIEG